MTKRGMEKGVKGVPRVFKGGLTLLSSNRFFGSLLGDISEPILL